jgi:hypothetical protein
VDNPQETAMKFRFSEKFLFTLFMLGGVTVIVYETLQLGRVARLVPLWVVLFTCVLLVWQTVEDFLDLPKARRLPRADSPRSIGEHTPAASCGDYIGSAPIRDANRRRERELQTVSWMILGFLAMHLFGFIVAAPAYIVLNYRLKAKEGWAMSLGCAAGVLVVTYGLLRLLMPTRLMDGIFWELLGI